MSRVMVDARAWAALCRAVRMLAQAESAYTAAYDAGERADLEEVHDARRDVVARAVALVDAGFEGASDETD